ncbi:hypothetical protein OUZ56_022962 [Daphnia magna]|uniref:Uncharacterized protein n=1 Tax=Daphnia magna TaxID=35525 RepID=A0ABR0AY14_9CRUS|nr:hypothetical protein OUZ56_022962 [Daphnia magna]
MTKIYGLRRHPQFNIQSNRSFLLACQRCDHGNICCELKTTRDLSRLEQDILPSNDLQVHSRHCRSTDVLPVLMGSIQRGSSGADFVDVKCGRETRERTGVDITNEHTRRNRGEKQGNYSRRSLNESLRNDL